ncbi:hypothetical protein ACIGXM_15720 [Kitasatospora sp. NPDC052896]|uniref:hypothetical protein n=1 Tax=Kitasatospora sp. NPDC052896 TaxID=3364061 RepID=UPI0037C9F2E4
MSTGVIIAIVVVVVVLVLIGIGLAVMNRRRRLKRRFGPEYERTVACSPTVSPGAVAPPDQAA